MPRNKASFPGVFYREQEGRNLDKYCAIAFCLTLPLGDDFDIFEVVDKLASTIPLVTPEEMHSRREALEKSRHSLHLEGLDRCVTPEADEQANAWVRGEITLEKAIENTLQRIRDGSNT